MPVVTRVEDNLDFARETLQAEQAQARYPELLTGAWTRRNGVAYHQTRPSSELVAIAVRQSALPPLQRRQLSTFRLAQFLLWRWYDPAVVSALHTHTDPAFDALPAETIHIVVGTSDGRILAYFAMQPAVDHCGPKGMLRRIERSASKQPLYLSDRPRPLFPAEFESFGPAVFASLPALRAVPIGRIRELTCMLRNYAIQSPLTVVAVVEAVYTACQVLMHPDLEIEAALGCSDVEARRVLADLGMPLLYAPAAPVIHNQLAFYWSPDMNAPGKFWPFVLATQDLRARAALLVQMNEVLSLTPQQMRRQLVLLRRHARVSGQFALLPEPGSSHEVWTSDPFYLTAQPAPRDQGTAFVAAEASDQDGTASDALSLSMHVAATADGRAACQDGMVASGAVGTQTSKVLASKAGDLQESAGTNRAQSCEQRRPRPVPALLLAAFALDMFWYGAGISLLPLGAQALHISPTTTGLLVASYGVGTLLVAALTAAFRRHRGDLPVLLLGLLALAVAILCFAVAPALPLLVMACALQGAGGAVTWIAGLTFVGQRYSARRRSRMFSRIFIAALAGALLGLIAGQDVHAWSDLRVPALAATCFVLLDAVGLVYCFPRHDLGAPQRPDGTLASAGRRRLDILALAATLAGAGNLAFLAAALPGVLDPRFGLGPSVIDLLFILVLVAFACAQPLARLTVRLLGNGIAVAFGLLAGALALVMVVSSADVAHLAIALSAVGLATAFMLLPALERLAASPGSRKLAVSSGRYGTYTVAWKAGIVLGPVLTRFIISAWTTPWGTGFPPTLLLALAVAAMVVS